MRPPPPPPETPRWFTGTFKGLHPENGLLSGALIFESEGKETVYLTIPEGLRDKYAKSLVEGMKYKFKFKPNPLFHSTKRITLAMLKEPPTSAD